MKPPTLVKHSPSLQMLLHSGSLLKRQCPTSKAVELRVRQLGSSFTCSAIPPLEVGTGEDEEKDLSIGNSVTSTHSGLGYSFTPGGLLVPYYIGVVGAMTDLGMIGPDTPVSGSSAGAIAAAFIASGLSMKDCLEANKKLQLEILQKGTFQKLIDPLHQTLTNFLPSDIHLRANGRVGIGVTIYRPLSHEQPMEGRVLHQFADKEDFVNAVVASCYIPFYLGPDVGIQYRGEMYSDGLPTHFFPEVVEPARASVERTITVSAFPRSNRFYRDGPGVDISPDNRPPSERYTSWQFVQRSLSPYPLDELEGICKQGYSDALEWGEGFLTQKIRENSFTARKN